MNNNTLDKFYSNYAYQKILKQYYSEKEILSYKSYFLKEKKKYFDHLKLHEKSIVLDVGTGRQSIALSRLFSKVNHFDIAKKHVLELNQYFKKNKVQNILSKRKDLETHQLEKNKYDFINLDGIVMHTNNPFRFVKNISKALKPNGVIKILFYRSGCLKFILISFLRKLIKKKKLKLRSPFKNKITGMLFDDDLYVPNIHFFDENIFLDVLKNIFDANNKYVKTKNFYNTKKVDTKNLHHSLTFFLTKKNVNSISKRNIKIKYINPLNENFLKKDKFFYDNIGKKLLYILKIKDKSKIFQSKNKELETIIIRIYKIALAHLFYQEMNYKDLMIILKSELIFLEQLYKKNKYD